MTQRAQRGTRTATSLATQWRHPMVACVCMCVHQLAVDKDRFWRLRNPVSSHGETNCLSPPGPRAATRSTTELWCSWPPPVLRYARQRCLVGIERLSALMLVRSAEALATMRPVLCLRVRKKGSLRENLGLYSNYPNTAKRHKRG